VIVAINLPATSANNIAGRACMPKRFLMVIVVVAVDIIGLGFIEVASQTRCFELKK
jgi:hypothetical protein